MTNSKGNIIRSLSNNDSSNLILIGMAGAGKSTLGPILAQRTGYRYIDTDDLIVSDHQASLQDILDQNGSEQFKKIEEQTLLKLDRARHVIATGGSVVYSQAGMAHLQQLGTLIFLNFSLKILEKRVTNFNTRGLLGQKDQSFADLFHERLPLYQQYADLDIRCDHCTPEQLAETILDQLRGSLQQVKSQED